ncbi:MAG: MazG-like family protein [Sporolactobacillus sp.]
MEINDVQQWEVQFYGQRGWRDLPPYVRVGFLTEEVGEVSRAVRTCEIGRDHPGEAAATFREARAQLAEEMGDVLSNLAILAALYGLTMEELVHAHRDKLVERYHKGEAKP